MGLFRTSLASLFKILLLVTLSCAVMLTQGALAGNWNTNKPVGDVQIDITSGKKKETSPTKPYNLAKDYDLVRLDSEYSQRFEIRHGECGYGLSWHDCPNDRQRVERRVKKGKAWQGKIVWFGFSFRLDERFPSIRPSSTSFAQIKTGYRQPVVAFYVEDQALVIRTVDNKACRIITLEDARGEWTDLVFGVDLSYDRLPGNGRMESGQFMEVHVNGHQSSCNFQKPIYPKKVKSKDSRGFSFDWGIYNSYVSRWLYENRTRDVDVSGWGDYHADSGKTVKSYTNEPFAYDWGVELPTQIIHYDELRAGSTRDFVDIRMRNNIEASSKLPIKSSPIDGDIQPLEEKQKMACEDPVFAKMMGAKCD